MIKRRNFLKGIVALSISVPVAKAQNCIPASSLPEPEPDPESDLNPLQSFIFDDTGHWCYVINSQEIKAMLYCTIPYDMTTSLPTDPEMTWVL